MSEQYAYGMWVVVAFSVGLFLFFVISFLPPKGRYEWRNMSLITAFLVALFSEMYGFPLTIYLLTGWLGEAYPVLAPYSHKYGHLWVVVFGGSTMAWVAVMGLSLVFLLAGYTLLSRGWQMVHGARDGLLTSGVYNFARHPQYTGLFLMISGFLIQWPTFLTVVMAPVLFIAYNRLASHEEKVMLGKFGPDYSGYQANTPKFFPSFFKWKAFLTAPVETRVRTMPGS